MQKRNSKGQFDKNSIPWNKGLKKSDIRVLNYIKKGRETRIINNSYVPWNKGLTKTTDCRIKKYAEKLKGKTREDIPWNKGMHTNFHSKSEWKKGNIPWNKGLTKETDERVKRNAENVKKTHWSKTDKREDVTKILSEKGKGKPGWNKGLTKDLDPRIKSWNRGLTKETDERVRKNAESVKENHWTKKSKHEVDKITEKMRLSRFSQKFPNKFTKIEVLLSEAIKKENILFKNHKNILNITEVDIFIEPNICIYCDGDYWHANPDKYDYSKLDSNQRWHVERDKRNNKILFDKGFIVIRFWEIDIKNSMDKCMNEIKNVCRENEIKN